MLASVSWAQNLALKKNNKTVTIVHNQYIEIITENNDLFKGRFQKIENNSIILEGRIIAIDQAKEIKFQPSRLNSALKGFVKGGLTCAGLTLAGMVVIAGVSSAELDGGAMLFAMVTTPFSVLIGGGVNAIRHSNKTVEVSYKIDQDNWRIVTDIVSLKRKKT
tara:strand:- start:215 stop:703 length:489 start_codon:yes stop_codon:yes gene_type:complete